MKPMNRPLPRYLPYDAPAVTYVDRTNPGSGDLQWLGYGFYQLHGCGSSSRIAHPEDESLLFGWKGAGYVELAGQTYELTPYDVLYVPRNTSYRVVSRDSEPATLIHCRAIAENQHPVYYARWADISGDEARIRHLKGKDVFLCFDVSEAADKLIAGFTIFEPHQRSYPPHNHTDQEEIYLFTQGSGAMEVYYEEESKSFVRSVAEGDAVTIPLLTYHPVFSQEQPLHFLWCIAGERYWVGDKNKDFVEGKVDKLTT
jgi:mannose-6-phosphate isomerase-like protein (cupin superfamily)